MTSFRPAFRVTIYNKDGTVLTPAADSWHTDPFQVTTDDALGGPWKPYMDFIEGAQGKIDPMTKNVEGSGMSFTVLDPVLSNDNSKRWVTSFIGNEANRGHLVGKTAFVEQRINNVWKPFGVYIITSVSIKGKVTYEFDLENLAEILDKTKVFRTPQPHPNARNFSRLTYSPLAISNGYGGIRPPDPMIAFTKTQSGFLQFDVLSSLRRRADNIYVTNSTGVTTFKSMVDYDVLKNIDLRVRMIDPAGTAAWHNKQLKIREIKTGRGAVPKVIIRDGVIIPLGENLLDLTDSALFWDWFKTEAVPLGDPYYINPASVPRGVNIQYEIFRNGLPGDDKNSKLGPLGILIADAPPNEFLEDLLDGYYGYLDNATGEPLQKFAYDISEVNWATYPTARYRVKEADQELGEFLRKNICSPLHIAYRWEPVVIDGKPTCRLKFIDLRMDTLAPSIPSLPTLTDAHMSAGASPEWTHHHEGANGSIAVKSRVEQVGDLVLQMLASGGSVAGADKNGARKDQFTLPSDVLPEETFDYIEIDAASGLNKKDGTYEIDAGLFAGSVRTFDIIKAEDGDIQEAYASATAKLESDLAKVATHYRRLVYDGMISVTADFLRSFSIVEDCQPGNWRFVDISPSNDPANNKRGGRRLMLCIERQDFEATCKLTFIDHGDGTVPTNAFTITGLTLNANQDGGSFTVGVSGADNRVEIQVAVLPLGSSVPAENSPLWTVPVGLGGQQYYTSGTYSINWGRQGRLVYIRGRINNRVNGANGAWQTPIAFPASSAVPNPIGFTATNQTSTTIQLNWTNPSNHNGTALFIENPVGGSQVQVLRINQGISSFTFTGLGNYSSTIRLVLKNIGANGDFSSGVGVNVSPSTAEPTEESPDILSVSISKGRAPGDPPESGGGSTETVLAIELRIAPGELNLPIEVERNDGTTTEIIATIPSASVTSPCYFVDFDDMENITYTYRLRHNAPDREPGAWTAPISVIPVLVPVSELNNPGNKGDKVMWVPDDLAFAKPITKIFGPQTEIQFRNRADTQTNLKIEDDGDITIRGNATVQGTEGVTAPKYKVGADQVVGARQAGPTNANTASGTAPTTGGSASAPGGSGTTVGGSAGATYTATEQSLINSLISANNANASLINTLVSTVSAQATLINGLISNGNTNAATLQNVITQYNDAVGKLNTLLSALRTHGLIS